MTIEQKPQDLDAILSAAQSLLDAGNPNEAMAYFWLASKKCADAGEWEKAGDCLYESAHCYELDGLYEKASIDYERAAELYLKGKLERKALGASTLAKESLRNRGGQEAKGTVQTVVIGAVGLNGSGKDVIVERLRSKYGLPMISIGDIVRDIAQEEGVEATRDNLHEISERYIGKFGPEYFPNRVIQKIEKQNWRFAGLSGIRTPTDVRVFQRHFGKTFILVHVEITDPRIRFKRLQQRGQTRDPKTYEEFLRQDAEEQEIFHLPEAISMATEKIKNDGTLEDLYSAVDHLAQRLGLSAS